MSKDTEKYNDNVENGRSSPTGVADFINELSDVEKAQHEVEIAEKNLSEIKTKLNGMVAADETTLRNLTSQVAILRAQFDHAKREVDLIGKPGVFNPRFTEYNQALAEQNRIDAEGAKAEDRLSEMQEELPTRQAVLRTMLAVAHDALQKARAELQHAKEDPYIALNKLKLDEEPVFKAEPAPMRVFEPVFEVIKEQSIEDAVLDEQEFDDVASIDASIDKRDDEIESLHNKIDTIKETVLTLKEEASALEGKATLLDMESKAIFSKLAEKAAYLNKEYDDKDHLVDKKTIEKDKTITKIENIRMRFDRHWAVTQIVINIGTFIYRNLIGPTKEETLISEKDHLKEEIETLKNELSSMKKDANAAEALADPVRLKTNETPEAQAIRSQMHTFATQAQDCRTKATEIKTEAKNLMKNVKTMERKIDRLQEEKDEMLELKDQVSQARSRSTSNTSNSSITSSKSSTSNSSFSSSLGSAITTLYRGAISRGRNADEVSTSTKDLTQEETSSKSLKT